MSWSRSLSWFLPLSPEVYAALLPPPLYFSRIGLHFTIGRRFAPQLCPLLTASQLVNRRPIRCFLLLLVTRCCCCFLGN
jgi:hypothetical protein